MATLLSSQIPEPKELLKLSPGELALPLLTVLLSLTPENLNLHNLYLGKVFTEGYPPDTHDAINAAVSGAWEWLRSQGYLGQRPNSSDPNWVMVTPKGRRWRTETFSVYDKTEPQSQGRTPIISLPVHYPKGLTASLLQLLVRGLMVEDTSTAGFEYSFAGGLLAFLTSNDPLSLWFQSYVEFGKISIEPILSSKRLSVSDFGSIKRAAITEEAAHELLIKRPNIPWTSSSEWFFKKAVDLAEQLGRPKAVPLDVRHLMGAYIYYPLDHERQLKEWGFNLEDWGSSFLTWLRREYRSELDGWVLLHAEIFRRAPTLPHPFSGPATPDTTTSAPAKSPEFGRELIGPSTHVARDRWTVDDSLGYFPYAYAIYRFLTAKGTQPPLSISIQAPWGGGKTSLMRMIQTQLDPEAANKLEKVEAPEDCSATVHDVIAELDAANISSSAVAPINEAAETRVTVWFNAWKYESTSQVWAGLADAIVKQVSERLSPKNRELFWLRLQLRRLDSYKVRQKVYEEVLSRFIRMILPNLWKYFLGLAAAALILLIEWLPVPVSLKYASPIGSFIVILGGLWSAAQSWSATQSKVDALPARITLGEFVTAPDYETNVGFIHHVVDDLKRALELIPARDRPVVIFVDDLACLIHES